MMRGEKLAREVFGPDVQLEIGLTVWDVFGPKVVLGPRVICPRCHGHPRSVRAGSICLVCQATGKAEPFRAEEYLEQAKASDPSGQPGSSKKARSPKRQRPRQRTR